MRIGIVVRHALLERVILALIEVMTRWYVNERVATIL